jgi:hypothetical protein
VKPARAAAVLGLSAVYFLHVFRFPHDAMVTTGLGDWVDPYFINFLLEHWYQSVLSMTDPSSPPMYFPARGTLGYSHALILYAPFYLALRPFLDAFQAYNATLFFVLLSGSLCLYAIFRKGLGVLFGEAALLTFFFFSSRNVVNGGTAVWSQRASVFLIPPILLMALVAARTSEGRLRLTLAGISGLLFTLLFSQDFYTAQFALLIVTLLLAGVLLVARQPLMRAVFELQETVNSIDRADPTRLSRRPNRAWLIAAVFFLAWAAIVALHPIERTTIASLRFSATDPTRPLLAALLAGAWYVCRHVRRWAQALRQENEPVAFESPLTNVVASFWKRERQFLLAFVSGGLLGVVVFLWIYAGAYAEHSSFPDEHLMNSLRPFNPGFWSGPAAPYDSLRTFTLVFVVTILAWIPRSQVDRRARLFAAWFAVVCLIVLVIPLRFDGFSIWKRVFAPLPGFAVIRDPGRIISLYELAAVLLTGLFLTHLPAKSLVRYTVIFLLFLFLATDWNPEVFDFGRPRTVYARWVEARIEIDPSCKSFFIRGASQNYMSRSFHMWALYNVDSMFIALDRSIPTLNGYSAWTPTGWGLANPQEPGYDKAVRQWIDRHGLRDVCELDIEDRKMRPVRQPD